MPPSRVRYSIHTRGQAFVFFSILFLALVLLVSLTYCWSYFIQRYESHFKWRKEFILAQAHEESARRRNEFYASRLRRYQQYQHSYTTRLHVRCTYNKISDGRGKKEKQKHNSNTLKHTFRYSSAK